jgi:hypothetical protein
VSVRAEGIEGNSSSRMYEDKMLDGARGLVP